MTSYEIYSLALALIVFFIFTVVFSVMIAYITRVAIKLIRLGDDDATILKQRKYLNRTPSKASKFERVFSAILSLVVVVIFVFSLLISCTENEFERGLSTLKIVKSESMATKNEKNEYLFENNLNDQFNMFDIVITRPLPAEDELQLYDIVVYERDGKLIIHRIVGIEEPNDRHSERHFMLQGDAVSRHDVYPVLYSQMHAVYEGERIPFVGSFITFLQSPAGWLCFILVMFGILVTPLIEQKLLEAMRKRLAALDALSAAAASAETSEVMAEEPIDVAVAEPEPIKTPEPAPVYRHMPPPEFKFEKRTPRAPKLPTERKAPEPIELERRPTVISAHSIKSLDMTPPNLPAPIAFDNNMEQSSGYHVVPIYVDKHANRKKHEMKPLTRYTKLSVKCDVDERPNRIKIRIP